MLRRLFSVAEIRVHKQGGKSSRIALTSSTLFEEKRNVPCGLRQKAKGATWNSQQKFSVAASIVPVGSVINFVFFIFVSKLSGLKHLARLGGGKWN